MTGDRALALAWGWVAHLRAGGTTPWATWLEQGTEAPGHGHHLPGAQQLELLRRLNQAGAPGADLADRVLAASAPGRGRPDRDLVGVEPVSRFGMPPVDPASLPFRELLRVATSLLAEDVVRAGVEPLQQGLLRPWRRRLVLAGDPWLAAPVRDRLVTRGRPEGGRDHVVVVVGRDLPGLVADVWTARSFADGVDPWDDWVGSHARRDRLPPRADLLRTARWWAERVGPERVHVVLEPARLPRLLGVRRRLPAPPAVSAAAADLARRVVPVMGLHATPVQRAELLRRGLAPRLSRYSGTPLAVPEQHRDWIADAARRLRDGLLDDGYAVHGDPDALLAAPAGGGHDGRESGTSPTMQSVFELALRVLLDGRSQA